MIRNPHQYELAEEAIRKLKRFLLGEKPNSPPSSPDHAMRWGGEAVRRGSSRPGRSRPVRNPLPAGARTTARRPWCLQSSLAMCLHGAGP